MTTAEATKLFFKYPSIENSLDKFVEKLKLQGYGNELYCITEKIHGSNTQIDYNCKTGEFSYGKRTAIIEENEACYNVQKIFDNMKENILELVNYVSKVVKGELEVIRVYGEVFGGLYPHEEVEKDNKAKKVQKGVYYSPHNEWRAFDISYTLVGDERNYFLSGHEFAVACAQARISTVPLLKLAEGIDEALKYPNDGESVIYKEYNLPRIEDNIMEGVVIKPWLVDAWMGQTRVILKNKNDRFKEKTHEKRVNIQIEVPENVKKAMLEIQQFITEARVHNVMSHLGEVSIQDIGKVIGLTARDALVDYKKEYGTLNTLEKSEEKMVTKFLQSEVAKVVRKVMLS